MTTIMLLESHLPLLLLMAVQTGKQLNPELSWSWLDTQCIEVPFNNFKLLNTETHHPKLYVSYRLKKPIVCQLNIENNNTYFLQLLKCRLRSSLGNQTAWHWNQPPLTPPGYPSANSPGFLDVKSPLKLQINAIIEFQNGVFRSLPTQLGRVCSFLRMSTASFRKTTDRKVDPN